MKKKTITIYSKILLRLGDVSEFERIKTLLEKYKPNTQRTYIIAILSSLRDKPGLENKRLLSKYRALLHKSAN